MGQAMVLGRVQRLGDGVLGAIEALGRSGLFLVANVVALLRGRVRGRRLAAEVAFIGARSTLVVMAAGLAVGAVVALQFHDTLVRFGATGLMGAAVGLSVVRELGPVLTALMLTARAGSATCAELAIMRVDSQLDALHCMGVDPLRLVVAPKVAAGILAMPLLAALFVVVGILGGWLVAGGLFAIGSGSYFQGMHDAVTWHDLAMGLTKSLVFGWLVLWVSATHGYFIHLHRDGERGAEGVSRTTTQAVVVASLAVLAADWIVSALMK